MLELSVRLLLSGSAVFAAGLVGRADFATLAAIAGIHAAWAFLLGRLEARTLIGPKFAPFAAAVDAALAGALIARLDLPSSWPVALSPLIPLAGIAGSAFSANRRAEPRWKDALAATVAGGAALLFAGGHLPVSSLGTIIALAATGLSVALAAQTAPVAIAAPAPTISATEEDEVLVELRLAFRKLRHAYRELEKSSRQDKIVAGLGEARLSESNTSPLERVAERLRKLAGAEGLVLYTLAQFDDVLTVAAAAGVVNDQQKTLPLELRVRHAAGALREEADALLQAMRGEGSGINVPLVHAGRVVGVLAATSKAPDPKINETLEGAAPWVAALVADHCKREAVERRLKETELLYGLSAATDGAVARTEVAARAARDLREMLDCDHVAISIVEDGKLIPLGTDGKPAPIMELMSFAGGSGLEGWLATGAPELTMPDVRRDGRCIPEKALKARIGAFCAIPMRLADGVLAVLTAASARVGGLDVSHVETLRAAAAELGRRLSKPLPKGEDGEGLLLPSEFAGRLLRGGALVTLDPQRLDLHETTFGKPAVAHALRTLASRVRARLPEGAAACRTPEGRLLVWLPHGDEDAAINWANETAAVASGLGLRTPDGTRRIPISVRAKAAALTPSSPGTGEANRDREPEIREWIPAAA